MRWPFQREPQNVSTLTQPEEWFLEWLGATPTAAGVSVNASTAMRCSVVNACVTLLSELAADLPVHVYKRGDDGGRERLRDHPADVLMSDFAAPWMPGCELRREVTKQMLLHGKGYARVIRRGKVPNQLHILPAGSVTVKCDGRTGEPSYDIALADGGVETVTWRDLIEIRTLDGVAPIWNGREAIALFLQLEQQVARLAANGNRPSGIISYENQLNEGKAKSLRESWEKSQNGDNRGKIAFLGGKATFVPIDFTSVDADTLAHRRQQAVFVAQFFRVSPLLLGMMEGSTFANQEQAGRELLKALQPILRQWTSALSRTLLTEPERKSGTYMEFKTAALLQADLKSRFEAMRLAIGGPWMTAAEGREGENLNRIDGSDGLYPPQGVGNTNQKEQN